MWDTILKKILEELIKAIQNIVKKKDIEDKCKSSADLISKAIRELLTSNPDSKKVKALLAKAERQCGENTEELMKAKGFLEAFENAKSMVARVPASAKKAVAKKMAAKKASIKISQAKKAYPKKASAKGSTANNTGPAKKVGRPKSR